MKTSGGALRRMRGGMLLAGVSGAAIACLLPGAASAMTYFVSSETELRNAITLANGGSELAADTDQVAIDRHTGLYLVGHACRLRFGHCPLHWRPSDQRNGHFLGNAHR
ncbi:hypothetical protein [Mesorhizobium sp. J8]|uniref:hypothetical protein n=1 Tax=Mesorhizobium sp. J8 TaxID=2777475 RepID=UPI001915BB93|nr:hypothetical protein [Mesorhizobium sp. J8]BCM21199.1 hypothetical protein MJ8_49910 [Mesorhizobium sp. J8]